MGTAGQRGGAGQPSGTSSGEITMLGHQVPLGRRSHTRVPSAETSTASPIPLRCTVWFDIPAARRSEEGTAPPGLARRGGEEGGHCWKRHFTTLLLRSGERERDWALLSWAVIKAQEKRGPI
jgi:hypothetical protein